jgi:hypothetical protein
MSALAFHHCCKIPKHYLLQRRQDLFWFALSEVMVFQPYHFGPMAMLTIMTAAYGREILLRYHDSQEGKVREYETRVPICPSRT